MCGNKITAEAMSEKGREVGSGVEIAKNAIKSTFPVSASLLDW